ncbi:MAG TPA: alpha/beta fold hydrolase [Gemmatimonadaceae bacterium]|nr:alpha/beta fold hydrolase [Gemmatimonadaceae bacterium]
MTFGQQADIIRGAETINLQEGNSRGILLLHGFGDTPQTLRLLAAELHAAGYDVRAPLLPGHGRSVESFAASRRKDWLAFTRSELGAMRQTHESVALAGLSMGGALASILAAEFTDTPALVLLAPYLDMPFTHKIAAATYWLGGADRLRRSNSPGSIRDPLERAKNVGYGAYSVRLLHELWRLGVTARQALPRIVSPTLVVQSRADPRIKPEVAERALASLGSREKKLVWIEGAGHIITVDYGREQVFREVREWMDAHVPGLATTA